MLQRAPSTKADFSIRKRSARSDGCSENWTIFQAGSFDSRAIQSPDLFWWSVLSRPIALKASVNYSRDAAWCQPRRAIWSGSVSRYCHSDRSGGI